MKISRLPPLHVSSELPRSQREFVERGLASAAKARRTGRYVSSGAALKSLKRQLEQDRARDK